MLEGLAAAFSMYSAIPVPCSSSGGFGTGAALFAFPAVGFVIGVAEIIAFKLLQVVRPGAFLEGCVLAVLPVLITGGIHMDGFMDTCDAVHSWKSRDERLAIMKDPHTGAYAVMGAVLYMLITAGLWSEMTAAVLPVAAAGFMLSRALSALAAAVFPKAKKDGMLKASADGMPANAGQILLMEVAVFALIVVLAGLVCSFIAAPGNIAVKTTGIEATGGVTATGNMAADAFGIAAPGNMTSEAAGIAAPGNMAAEVTSMAAEASAAAGSVPAMPPLIAGLMTGAAAVLAEILVFGYYYRMSLRTFGGITGDLAGWFLQLAELAMLAAIFVVGRLTGLV